MLLEAYSGTWIVYRYDLLRETGLKKLLGRILFGRL
jgi:hypothetical protein